jgi:hypothetical protein
VEQMMKRVSMCVVVLAGLTLYGCGGSSPSSPSSSGGSGTGSSSSHNAGRDCTSCHAFTVAGTAYKSDGSTVYPGALIRVTTGSAGTGTTLVALTADGSGNFYTSAAISFGSGLYPTATGTGGAVRSMTAAITSGGCNRCHVAGMRIVVD